MKNTPGLIGVLLLLCMAQYGCVQLKEVHAFTETSQKALENDHQIGYEYADYCWDSCYLYNVSGKQLMDFDCDCSHAEIYDMLINKEYRVLGDYFIALGKLSGAKSTIDFAPVATAVAAGTYGALVITSTESSVVTALSTAASDLFTTKYKSKTIKEILVKYHDTAAIAMELLQLHIDNLKSMIGLMRTKLQQRCDLLMAKTAASPASSVDAAAAEKWAIVYIYKQKYRELERIMASYDKRYRSLDKIRQGHITLYENVNDLKSDGFKKRIIGLATDIIYINNH
jgi:hypothetical protein